VSNLPATAANATAPPAPAPFQNPSYPKRIHFGERESLMETLRDVEKRLEQAARVLNLHAGDSRAASSIRHYHQLAGARDQIAECVRRMPLETGRLYEEDRERLLQAVAAFERVWKDLEPRPA
jgi:hypothetical protein